MENLSLCAHRRKIRLIVILTIVAVVLLSFIVASIVHIVFVVKGWIEDENYYLNANWNCDNETLENEYLKCYYDKIEELKNKYGLSFEQSEFTYKFDDSFEREVLYYDIFLYTEEYTILIHFLNSGSYATCTFGLYYYNAFAENPVPFDITTILNFLNDFTNYAAFDTKTDENYFEKVYMAALDENKTYKSECYHSDSLIGDVAYRAFLEYQGTNYMGKKDSYYKKPCHLISFRGILKSL